MPSLTRSELAAYALCAVVVVLIGLRAMKSPQTGSPAPEPVAARPAAGEGDGPVVQREPEVRPVVHVVGAVRRPGLYTLRAGSRVADAVRRAGGVTARADTGALNLAAKVLDAQQVVVPQRGAASPAAAPPGSAPPGAPQLPISLNSATAEQLDELDGIGPATAAKILELRTQRGGFRSVDDLADVPGIGPKRLESLRAQVGV